jgi:hypothetical protein
VPPHLGQRGLAGFPDRGEGLPQVVLDVLARRAVRIRARAGAEQMQGGPRLHGDGGHAVRHRVMQLPGDKQPLLGHPAGRFGVAFLLGQPQPARRLRGQRPPAADQRAECDRRAQHPDAGQEIRG